MTEDAISTPLITAAHVREWVAERDALAREYSELLSRLRSVQQKLDALAQLLPENVLSALLGEAPDLPAAMMADPASASTLRQRGPARAHAPSPPREKRVPITDAIEAMLAGEAGGRSPAWFRARLGELDAFKARVEKTPTSISNALLRLVERRKAVRDDGLYYHPDIFARIRSGELVEERLENPASLSFNSVMHKVMQERGKPFTAAEAIAAARENEFLRERLEEQPNRIYSWLSRELFKNKLRKEGDYYSHPSNEEEAPSGNPPSASFAREGGASLFDNQRAEPAD
ncbi:MAG TPA: hypothetical protein VI168_04830 [Croceibacterium sp.]